MDAVRKAGAFACFLTLVAGASFNARADDEEKPKELPILVIHGTRDDVIEAAPAPPTIPFLFFSWTTFPPLPAEEVLEEEDVEGCDSERGNPVRLPSGLKVEEETDFASDGEMGLYLKRTYGQRSGLFGARWRSNFDYALQWDDGGNIRAIRPNGGVIGLPYASGVWRETPDKPLPRVEKAPDGMHTLFNEAGGTEVYDRSGRIHIVRNAQGIAWYYEYAGDVLQRVTHTSGRSVQFTWSGPELREVTDPAGSVYRYGYHRVGLNDPRLADVTLPGTPTTVIRYDSLPSPTHGAALGNLTGKVFDEVRYSTFVYGRNAEDAKTLSTEHTGGVERHSFTYHGDPDDKQNPYTIVETNPLGHKTTRKYLDGRLISVEGIPSANCAGGFRELKYDTKGQPDRVTDFAGIATEFDHDAAGRLIRKVEAVGTPVARTRTYAWVADQNRVLTTTLQGISETKYTYTPNGRVTSETTTDLATGEKRATTYAYVTQQNGILRSMTVEGPSPGDKRTHLYSSQGDLLETRNAAGHATKYSGHNGRGQPARIVEPAGAVTEYEYDARGRVVVERAFPNGAPVETRYVYGKSGLLDAKHTADGTTRVYHYDAARRLIQEDRTEPDGTFAVRRITYNALSQPIRIEVGRD